MSHLLLRLFTINAIITIAKKHGLQKTLTGKINLQADIANNRRDRENKPIVQSLNTLDLGEWKEEKGGEEEEEEDRIKSI